MLSIYRKELRSYFVTLIAPAVMAFMLLFAGIFVCLYSMFGLASSIEVSYTNTLFVLILAVPVLTMKSFAEERRAKTDILLFTLPISTTGCVLGKYLSMLTVITIPLFTVFLYTFVLSLYGEVNFLSSSGATLAFVLCGAAMLAIGLFISSLTESVIISAVLTFATLLVIYFLPSIVLMLPASSLGSLAVFTVLIIIAGALVYYLTGSKPLAFMGVSLLEGALAAVFCLYPSVLEGAAAKVVSALSLTERFESFSAYGVFDVTSIVYYITITALFVFLTVQSVGKRRIR